MTRALHVGLFALFTIVVSPLRGQPPPPVVQFQPMTAVRVPLDTHWVDETGRAGTLRSFMHGRPAILALGYYSCSNLCGVLLDSLARALTMANVTAPYDVEVVVVSIDAFDTPALARLRKEALERAGAREMRVGWHFLTGRDRDIHALAQAAGYTFTYDAATRQYAHPAGVLVLRPDGRIGAPLFGVSFSPAALRAAIAAASTDRTPAISTGDDRQWLLCFHYDPRTGRYTPIATGLVRFLALAVMVVLGTWMARQWRRGRAS